MSVEEAAQKAYDLWQEMRRTIFSEENLQRHIEQYTNLLGESGALMREAERWETEMYYPDGYELVDFASVRWPLIDQAMDMLMETEGQIAFLSATNYAEKAGDILAEE